VIYIGMVIIVVAADRQPLQVWPFPKPEPPSRHPDDVLVKCDRCTWSGHYSPDKAKRGLAGHKSRCKH